MTFFAVSSGSSQSSSLSRIHQIEFWWIWIRIRPIKRCGSGSRADYAGLRRASKRDAATRKLGILVLWQDSPDHDPVDLDLDPTNQTHGPGSRAAKSDQSNALLDIPLPMIALSVTNKQTNKQKKTKFLHA